MKWAAISTWKMSFDGCKKTLELLAEGRKCDESLIEGVCMVEDEPSYTSVGYGGLPDKDGRVTLDGGFMDGDTLRFGAVGCIEGFRSPVRIAHSLMNYEFNNLLVGKGAEKYAEEKGFEKRNNLTEKSYQKYLSEKDKIETLTSYDGHDTVCFLGKDVSGTICAAVSTSGLYMKAHGRIGDSPIPGAGYYADSEIGSAASTGVGEDVIKTNATFRLVNKMAQGMSVQKAADETLNEIMKRLADCRSISLIALDKDGNYGVATNCDFPFVYGSDECEVSLYMARFVEGKTVIEKVNDISEVTLD